MPGTVGRHGDVQHGVPDDPPVEGGDREDSREATADPHGTDRDVLGLTRCVPPLSGTRDLAGPDGTGEVRITSAPRDELLFLGEPAQAVNDVRDGHAGTVAEGSDLAAPMRVLWAVSGCHGCGGLGDSGLRSPPARGGQASHAVTGEIVTEVLNFREAGGATQGASR